MKFISALLLFLCYNSLSYGQSTGSLSIWIPQNSGLFLVDYEIFELKNDAFYVIHRTTDLSIVDTNSAINYHYDTLSKTIVSNAWVTELNKRLLTVHSLGNHVADGCDVSTGEMRFYIYIQREDLKLDGFISNCYREHIFRFVDILNAYAPNGAIVPYDKEKLMETEKRCNSYRFGLNAR